MQIKNGFWLAENTVCKTTIEKLTKYSKNPNTVKSKKYVFQAKCIENAVPREKYSQQNRGKWATETKKQATYNRLR